MERIKNMSVEELDDFVAAYTASGSTPSGVEIRDCVFTVNNDTLSGSDPMKADLPEGFTTEVMLEADGSTLSGSTGYAYPNANSLNLSEFNPISVRDCAVYTMDATYDEDAYNVFASRSTADHTANPLVSEKDADYFKDNLSRKVEIEIKDAGGTYIDSEGNSIDLVKVNLKITYKISAAYNVVASGNGTYVSTEVTLFDNSATHKPLNGIYYFYYPRYKAAASTGDKETIEITNTAGAVTDLYIVAMNGAADAASAEAQTYITGGRTKMKIVDKERDADGYGRLTLRTNLLQTNSVTNLMVPYSSKDDNDYRIGFSLTYKPGSENFSADKSTDPNLETANQAIKGLNIGYIDGKSIMKDSARVRIYRVTVTVKDADGNPISILEGTKLRQG